MSTVEKMIIANLKELAKIANEEEKSLKQQERKLFCQYHRT